MICLPHRVREAALSVLDGVADNLRDPRLSTSNHVAAIVDANGRLLAIARNKAMTPSKGCGASAHTMHAEIAVIKKLGDLKKLAGCTLVVARFTPCGDVASSAPCSECRVKLEKMFTRYRLKCCSVHLNSLQKVC